MASETSSPPETKSYDLTIRVIEHEDVESVSSATKEEHDFKVKRSVLYSKSDYFRRELRSINYFKKSQEEDIIKVHDNHVQAFAVWFKILHDEGLGSTYATTGILCVWEMLAVAHKYGLNAKSEQAKAWFEKWYKTYEANKERKTFNYVDYQMLLFPCHTFDHALGFAAATKYLAYRATEHATEKRPNGFKIENLRLDQMVIQQINAAKGRLKTVLQYDLNAPINTLLKHRKCSCKKVTVYDYLEALSNAGAGPLDMVILRRSMHDILCGLQRFDASALAMPCHECALDFKSIVSAARTETAKYFEGLCLDCMDASKPKLGDADGDYWIHAGSGKKWSENCRIQHRQPTWYFSFMGRREKMIEWQERRVDEREERDLAWQL